MATAEEIATLHPAHTYAIAAGVRAASGRVIWLDELTAITVNTATYLDAKRTAERIVSEAMFAGVDCSMPAALAAAFSVPDGAPIAMALDNLGVELRDSDAAWYERERENMRRTLQAMPRGR